MGLPHLLAIVVIAMCVALGIAPRADRLTWLLENLPVILGLPVLALLHHRRPLTTLLCVLVAIHAVILMVGGHYTYAAVPAGDWVRDAFGLARNPYDRLGHLAQGFIPAILIRELCMRRGLELRGWFGGLLIVLACLGFSAIYEIIEWRAAVGLGDGASDFLGSQGDIWDAQWDMACCGIGALLALFTLGWLHDRQFARFSGPPR